MEIGNLGQSGLRVSATDPGCNNFSSRIDGAVAKTMIHKALYIGIMLFDTADVYGEHGRFEAATECILGDDRKGIMLAPKFAAPMNDSGVKFGGSRQFILTEVKDNGRRNRYLYKLIALLIFFGMFETSSILT